MVLCSQTSYVSCLFVLNFCSFCFQIRDDDLVIILFFLLENVITDGDYHLCLGSGSKYFNNWKLFPSVLLDALFLRVTSLLIAACQICFFDIVISHKDTFFPTPYEIIYTLSLFSESFC